MQENHYEIDNRTMVNHEGPRANIPVKRLTAASIIGDTVENDQGDEIGKITNLMINLRESKVEYVVLETGAFLGLAGKLFAIPLAALKINPEKKSFTLNADKEYFSKLPGFDKTHWPDTNEHETLDDVVPPFP